MYFFITEVCGNFNEVEQKYSGTKSGRVPLRREVSGEGLLPLSSDYDF